MTNEHLIQLAQASENIRCLRTNIEFVQKSFHSLPLDAMCDDHGNFFDEMMDFRISLEMFHKKVEDHLSSQTKEGAD